MEFRMKPQFPLMSVKCTVEEVRVEDISSTDSTAHEDTIYLQSKDDTLFPISRTLLSHHSSFFADLPIFLTSSSSNRTIIPIPEASAHAISLIIHLLPKLTIPNPNCRRIFSPNRYKNPNMEYIRTLTFSDLSPLVEAFGIARTYELDTFISAFYNAGLALQDDRPLFAWTLSALTEKWMNVDRRAMETLSSTEALPENVKDLLRDVAPRRLERYLAIRGEWDGVVKDLWRGLMEGLEGVDGDYAERCKGVMGMFGCKAHSIMPRWNDLRTMVARRVYEAVVAEKRSQWTELGVQGTIGRVVPCLVCTKRIWNSFERVMVAFWVQSAKFRFR